MEYVYLNARLNGPFLTKQRKNESDDIEIVTA